MSLTTEEEGYVKHFEENYLYTDDAKFVVKLPVKIDV